MTTYERETSVASAVQHDVSPETEDLGRSSKIVPIRRAPIVLLVLFLALLVSATPLSAVVSPGHFELRLPGDRLMPGFDMPLDVVLDDETGLVVGLVAAPHPNSVSSAATKALVVSWTGGCGDWVIAMRFSATTEGYRLTERTTDKGCQLFIGIDRSFVLVLYTPIDPATVEIVHV